MKQLYSLRFSSTSIRHEPQHQDLLHGCSVLSKTKLFFWKVWFNFILQLLQQNCQYHSARVIVTVHCVSLLHYKDPKCFWPLFWEHLTRPYYGTDIARFLDHCITPACSNPPLGIQFPPLLHILALSLPIALFLIIILPLIMNKQAAGSILYFLYQFTHLYEFLFSASVASLCSLILHCLFLLVDLQSLLQNISSDCKHVFLHCCFMFTRSNVLTDPRPLPNSNSRHRLLQCGIQWTVKSAYIQWFMNLHYSRFLFQGFSETHKGRLIL